MKNRRLAGTIVVIVVVGIALVFGYERWRGSGYDPRNDLLAQLPADSSAVLYIDLDGLRQSPFLAELYKWAPQAKADADYAQFLQSTGFNYETDLHRVSIAFSKRGEATTLFALAEGRFDRKKISSYASHSQTARISKRRCLSDPPIRMRRHGASDSAGSPVRQYLQWCGRPPVLARR